MLKQQNNWKIASLYCPNCGQLLHGCPDAEGKIRITCSKCGMEMVLASNGRRQDTLKLFPRQQPIYSTM